MTGHFQTGQEIIDTSRSYRRKKRIISGRVNHQQCFNMILGFLVSCIIYGIPPRCQVNAYHSTNKQPAEISSPNMACLSGTASFSQIRECPSTNSEMKDYPGVVMDEYGYVHIKLVDIQMKVSNAGDRKLEEESSENSEVSEEEEFSENSGVAEEEESSENSEVAEEEEVSENSEVSEEEEVSDNSGVAEEEEVSENSGVAEEEVMPESSGLKAGEKETSNEKDISAKSIGSTERVKVSPTIDKKSTNSHNFSHHLQLFLVNLDEGMLPNWNHCCYEDNLSEMQSECSINDPKHVRKKGKENSDTSSDKFSHDYRLTIKRIGEDQVVTAPIPVAVEQSNASQPVITLDKKLHPQKFGRYMLVISNCAAEMSLQPDSLTKFTAVINDIDIRFVSRFGELPLSMMGIIPFYGLMLFMYMILAAVWWKRSFPSRKNKNIHLLGLQRAIRNLVFMETLFSVVAFSYYLHLNGTPVDLDVLYSGTAAALLNWGPWSMFVATVHFLTIFGCQVVVTLATDGTWLIQSHIREDTRKAMYALGTIWLLFFGVYGFVSPSVRTTLFLAIFLSWVIFLLFNVRRSIRHLRSLMIGQSTDNVMAIGGALVAKRSLYRRIYAVVAIYPIIFLLGLYWNYKAQADSWNWVGYVLGDLYLFFILLHASIIWLPRSMSSQEFIKYAPLEVSVTANNDLELWEEGVNEDWGEEEIELSQGSKLH